MYNPSNFKKSPSITTLNKINFILTLSIYKMPIPWPYIQGTLSKSSFPSVKICYLKMLIINLLHKVHNNSFLKTRVPTTTKLNIIKYWKKISSNGLLISWAWKVSLAIKNILRIPKMYLEILVMLKISMLYITKRQTV